MREIKFRAWDGNRMFPVDHLTFNEGWFVRNPEGFDNKSILMQFTGLKDKNGKEIYEGDIVSMNGRITTTVEWANDLPGFALSNRAALVSSKDEVIGNIYEHGHLLNESGSDIVCK